MIKLRITTKEIMPPIQIMEKDFCIDKKTMSMPCRGGGGGRSGVPCATVTAASKN